MVRRHTEMVRRQWFKRGWLWRHELCSSRPQDVHHTRQLICRTLSSVPSSSSSSSLLSRLGPEPSAIGYNDYEAERRTFRLEQPQFYNFASDVIDRWARTEQVVSPWYCTVYAMKPTQRNIFDETMLPLCHRPLNSYRLNYNKSECIYCVYCISCFSGNK